MANYKINKTSQEQRHRRHTGIYRFHSKRTAAQPYSLQVSIYRQPKLGLSIQQEKPLGQQKTPSTTQFSHDDIESNMLPANVL